MAQIGLRYLKYSPLQDGQPTEVKTLGRAIKCKPTLTTASAKLYADDKVAEDYDEVIGGTLEVEVDDMTSEVYAEVFGHHYDETDKTVVRNAEDTPIHIRLGRIVTKLVNNKKQYKVEVLMDVKFKETLPEEVTKADSITLGTLALSGDFYVPDNGDWSIYKYFDNFEEASAYLNTCLASETAS